MQRAVIDLTSGPVNKRWARLNTLTTIAEAIGRALSRVSNLGVDILCKLTMH